MKIKPILLTAILLMATQAFAQEGEQLDTQPQPIRKSKVPIWLNAGVGLNAAHCYDNGTIPFGYTGIGANFNLGVTVEWHRCHIQTDARLLGDMLVNLNG